MSAAQPNPAVGRLADRFRAAALIAVAAGLVVAGDQIGQLVAGAAPLVGDWSPLHRFLLANQVVSVSGTILVSAIVLSIAGVLLGLPAILGLGRLLFLALLVALVPSCVSLLVDAQEAAVAVRGVPGGEFHLSGQVSRAVGIAMLLTAGAGCAGTSKFPHVLNRQVPASRGSV